MTVYSAMSPRSVLIVKPDTYGDLVLISTLLWPLAEAWPECKIHILVREGYEDISYVLPPNINWLTTSINPYLENPSSVRIEVSELLNELKSVNPELVIAGSISMTWLEVVVAGNFPNTKTVAFENFYIAKGMGFDLQKAYGFDPQSVFEDQVTFDAGIEDWRNWGVMAKRFLGETCKADQPRLDVPYEIQRKADRWLSREGLFEERWVACCPAGTANVPLKTWPVESYIDALTQLYREHGVSSLLLGHANEDATLKAISYGLREQKIPVFEWRGKDGDFSLLAALIRRAQIYFGNDTGAMHLAAAVDIPVVAVFGGGTWPRFRPSGRRTAVVYQRLECFGCGWDCPFGNAPCVGTIPVKLVGQALEYVLGQVAKEFYSEFLHDGEMKRFGTFAKFSKHYWTGSIPWYEESKFTGERIRKQARYLEQIADRTDSVFLKAEWLKGAISIRMDRGDKGDILRLSEKLFALPEDLQQGAWRYKFYELFDMGARGSEEALALFKRGDRSDYILAAMADRVFDSPDDPYFQLVLEALEESDSSVPIQGNDSAVRGFAISRDGWTRGQDPGYLILKNGGDSPLMFTLKLVNHAPDNDLPITVTVSDGISVREGVFADELRDMLRIPLDPVEPGEERIVRIKADKAWWPQEADGRKLGIRVFLEEILGLEESLEQSEPRF